MRRYVAFVVRHRVAVLVALAVISVLSLLALQRAVIASSARKLFFGDSPAYNAYLERTQVFASDEVVLVGVEVDDAFTAEVMERVEAATQAIEGLDEVSNVESPSRLGLVQGRPGVLEVDEVGELVARGAEGAAEARRRVLDDPLYRGMLIGHDGRAVVLLVELLADPDRKAEAVPATIETIRQAVLGAGFAPERVHLFGRVASLAACVDLATRTLVTLTPVVIAVLLAVVFLLFRRLWPVAVTGAVAALATLWTMAFAILLDREVNIMLSMVPAVIMVIAFSDVVHLCSAYLTLVTDGRPKDEAILEAGSEVGLACFLTSVTTFFGFAAMVFVPTPVFRQLGLVLGTGVAIALGLALTLAPILFSLMPTPRPTDHRRRGLRLVDGLIDACRRLAMGRPAAVVAGFGVFAAVAGWGVARIEVDTSFSERFEDDHPVTRAARFFERSFRGTQPVDLFIEATTPGALREPEVLAALEGVQRRAEARPEIGVARSIVDLLGRIHRAFNAGDDSVGPLPTSSPMVAQYLLLFEMAGGSGVNRLIDADGQRMRMVLQVEDTAFRAVARAAEGVRDDARAVLGDRATVEVSSLSHLFGDWLASILRGQEIGLLFSSLIIALIMGLGLRSARVGLWSMVPNLLPLLALGGLVGFLYDRVDSDTLPIAMIAIGIGVDDTVHFLSRLRLEVMRGDDIEAAVERTFRFAGAPIVMTTMILGLGFAPMALSGYYSTSIIGTLLPFTLVVALIADLLLVPALVRLGWIRWRA